MTRKRDLLIGAGRWTITVTPSGGLEVNGKKLFKDQYVRKAIEVLHRLPINNQHHGGPK